MVRPKTNSFPARPSQFRRGFALVSVLLLMVLLGLLSVGLLSLSAVSLRTSGQRDAMNEARANAKMALLLAIGKLQEEMGPDMRVGAKSAIFDLNPTTEAIEGVSQPNWLASYESWGGWLNASYVHPETGETLSIADTYTPQREKMFRKWLLSMPEGMDDDINAPMSPSGWDDDNSVILVGEGSLGETYAGSNPEQITRAYLNTVNETGRSAWWIGPENQKALIDKAKQPRNLAVENWEVSSGDTAEVGVGSLTGFDALDSDESISAKLISQNSLRPAGVDEEVVGRHFFDVTGVSRGVLTSVRTGRLKKDLSLLFEKDKADLPDLYRFDPGDIREPSIRPMSSEIADKAVLKERHFAPWNRMRHFYRMYRQDSDALAPGYPYGTPSSTDGTGFPALRWSGAVPWADCNFPTRSSDWDGQDSYPRFPIVTHITYILKLRTTPRNDTERNLESLAAPVYVLWNPYNVELRLPDKAFMTRDGLSEVQPLEAMIYRPDGTQDLKTQINWSQYKGPFSSHDGPEMSDVRDDIVFKPGQFRVFSPLRIGELQDSIIYHPGFDPSLLGGADRGLDATAKIDEDPPRCEFHIGWGTYYRWNTRKGNTPASFVAEFRWLPARNPNDSTSRSNLPLNQHVDWFNTNQYGALISPQGGDPFLLSDSEPFEVGYFQLVLKGLRDHAYPTIGWEQDWRCRNWIQAPPYYFVKGLYMSEDPMIAHTQRIDCPYEFRFGPIAGAGLDFDDIVPNVGESALMGPDLPITAAPALELPTAPIGSLAGFSGMRVNPGWTNPDVLNPNWGRSWSPAGSNTTGNSLYGAESKANACQSGITGPGIGNSFLHPMIPRTDVYGFLNNSVSMDMLNEEDIAAGHTATDTKAYCDYWDHVLLLNDALWDDYFVSSLADQTRPGASASASLQENLDKLVASETLANSRYEYFATGEAPSEVKADLEAEDGYLKAASHLMVDGMFNVNSTSVAAWQALFAGIRERQVVYRDQNGALKKVGIPSDKRIALSRFGVATTDQDGIDPEFGIIRDDGMQAWSGVRFLDDDQLGKLAEECVKQVKQRGPFLNFSEFINRRLSDDALGTMGALQAAIDYDDGSPESGSINYPFKSNSDYMLEESDLGNHSFSTPDAAVGSRFAGIPGYVIQSDLLKPIANTLSVRDDTFRIRAYGDALNENGEVIARAWCEAIVQRTPEYCDDTDRPEVPSREISADGEFSDIDDSPLSTTNRRYGRKFEIESFRWLNASEV